MAHGKPEPGKDCLVSFEPITEANYVEFKAMPSGKWVPCGYSQEIVEYLLASGWESYMKDVEKASKDCAAAVRRLVVKGPPIFLSDGNHGEAIPLPSGDTHAEEFWFMNGNRTVSGKLKGAFEGKEREELWSSQKETLGAMEASEASTS